MARKSATYAEIVKLVPSRRRRIGVSMTRPALSTFEPYNFIWARRRRLDAIAPEAGPTNEKRTYYYRFSVDNWRLSSIAIDIRLENTLYSPCHCLRPANAMLENILMPYII